MSSARESAAMVALLRLGRRRGESVAEAVEAAGSAESVLRRELSNQAEQTSLLPEDPEALLVRAHEDLASWRAAGYRPLTVLCDDYPANLRRVHDRPSLIFVAGDLAPEDVRSVAVIGSRRASATGLAVAARISEHLVATGYVVVSGLAAGVDTAAHTAALHAGGRTVAVIGTGLARSYPSENAALQARIAREAAVLSPFWPDEPPSRHSFPRRNAVMSGLALGTVVVEASPRSGTRIQARIALAHGRPVFLWSDVLEQSWARDLVTRPGVHVVTAPDEITSRLERLNATDALVE